MPSIALVWNHRVAFHRGDADALRVDAAARRDHPQIGVRIGLDGADRDRAPAQHLHALVERRLRVEARRRGQVLAHDDLDRRPIERAGDRQHALTAGGGPRERRA
jgi:hypothetical protein